MSQYVDNIIGQAVEVERMLNLPDLQSYEVRSLNGRKKGLQKQVLSSGSLQRRLNPSPVRVTQPRPVRAVRRNKRGRVWARYYE